MRSMSINSSFVAWYTDMYMKKITPCLWFDNEAEEAAAFYTSVFQSGSIIKTSHYLTETPSNKPLGSVMEVYFEIEGQTFSALNGGDFFTPNPSISFFVNRDSAEEVEELWNKLIEGGIALMPLGEYPFSQQYGWVQDKYGISWQIIFSNPNGDPRPNIVPSLLFTKDMNGKAEAALRFYDSVFTDTELGQIVTYPEDTEMHEVGNLMFGDLRIEEQWLAAMDGGTPHQFSFSEGISLQVFCEDQTEIDELYEKLSAVPEAEVCGWLKDKFGVSWQIVPEELIHLLDESDSEKTKRVMEALLKMKKLDVETLRNA